MTDNRISFAPHGRTIYGVRVRMPRKCSLPHADLSFTAPPSARGQHAEAMQTPTLSSNPAPLQNPAATPALMREHWRKRKTPKSLIYLGVWSHVAPCGALIGGPGSLELTYDASPSSAPVTVEVPALVVHAPCPISREASLTSNDSDDLLPGRLASAA